MLVTHPCNTIRGLSKSEESANGNEGSKSTKRLPPTHHSLILTYVYVERMVGVYITVSISFGIDY
jgi:hypothetical protein